MKPLVIQAPFVIAEVSGNHMGSLHRAKELVHVAAESGASAVKFQTYTADTMTIPITQGNFLVTDTHPLWGGRSLYDLYHEAHTPWEWHQELFELARSLGIIPFSSPFDASAVDFLESLDTPAYKIASLEINDHALIAMAARTGKPLIISTGAATRDEIVMATDVAKGSGSSQVIVLKCTSSYPADPLDANLNGMASLRALTGCEIGLSDHTLGIAVSVAAVALGAVVIEKHITLDRNDGAVDSSFSLTPDQLSELVAACHTARNALGTTNLEATASESESLRHKRSLYVVEDVKMGQEVTSTNTRSIRPGGGLPPYQLIDVLGKRFKCDITAGTPMTLNIIE